MNGRKTLIAASLMGALAVGLGAFGAHALKALLLANARTETYELAVRYQFYHTFALFATGMLMEKFPGLRIASILFLIGIMIFSGSLYILALTNQTWWGTVTPMGGVTLMAGWAVLGWAFYKGYRQPT